MMATLAMDREREMARFIDTYKFDQDMAYKRDKFGGGTVSIHAWHYNVLNRETVVAILQKNNVMKQNAVP